MSNPHDILSRYLQPGITLVGRYQLERAIGQGAYGAIYAAVDTVSHERVAIKALPPAGETTSRTAQGRFKREMTVIESLVHPNIIAMYDYGQTEQGVPFMVLEYVEGVTLERQVKGKPMSLDDGLDVMIQLTGALGAAHACGVIHRDLKPANVMVVSDHHETLTIKVLDFGMAKVLSKIGDQSIVALTREGVAVGTPRYIAPEQARGLEVGPYTDLYAAGLLMYEIFTGERAVKADTIEAAVAAHVSREPLAMPEGDRIPRVVMPIIQKLLAKRIEERYQRAEDVRRDLEKVHRALRQAGQREQLSAIPQPVKPKPAPGTPPPAINDISQLELDVERVSRFETERRERNEGRYDVRPNSETHIRERTIALAFAETLVAVPLGFCAFVLATAHFDEFGYLIRMIVGAAPFILAVLIGHYMGPRYEWLTKARTVLCCAVLLILGAHTYDFIGLTGALYQEPAWFLKPMSSLPLLDVAYDIVTSVGRGYAKALMPLAETF